MPFILNVSFQDKEKVEKLGAWWLPQKKKAWHTGSYGIYKYPVSYHGV